MDGRATNVATAIAFRGRATNVAMVIAFYGMIGGRGYCNTGWIDGRATNVSRFLIMMSIAVAYLTVCER